MPDLNLDELEAVAKAAQQAAPQEWQIISYEGKSRTGSHQYSVCSESGPSDQSHVCVATLLVDADGDTRLPEFVAAANPSTLLTLISEVRALRAAVEGQGWIACSERMPKHRQQVLIWSSAWMVNDEPNCAEFFSEETEHFAVASEGDEIYQLSDVTHWRPLPAPPEGKP